MNYPGNQMEFEAMFKTEQDCINYLVSIRWPHDFECPVCGSMRYWAKNKGRFECRDCHAETTVTKRGRGAEGKSLVAVAVEIVGRKTGRMRLAKIPNASSESLHKFIEANIEESSKIITDGWLGYNGLSQIGYEHEIQESKVKDGDEEILPNVHRIASLLKRWLLGTHQSYLNKNKLEYYLDEYVFRYNRRTSKSRGLLFLRLVEQAVIMAPVSYEKIINENHG